MKLLRKCLIAISAFSFLSSLPASALAATPYVPPLDLTASSIIITSYSFASGSVGYVQLFNESDSPVDLTGWNVRLANQAGQLSVPLSGWIAPHNYLIAGDPAAMANADFNYTVNLAVDVAMKIELVPPSSAGIAVYSLEANASGMYQRKKSTSTGNYLSTFEKIATPALFGGGFYTFPDATLLQVSEILANPRQCSPLESDMTCSEYVKLFNSSAHVVDLSAFRLRIGDKNQTSSASNTYALSGDVAPGHFVVLSVSADDRPLSVTNSGGFVWLEDAYGMRRYDETVQPYPDASADSKRGQAWAYDISDGLWKWTSHPTPTDQPNAFPVMAATTSAPVEKQLAMCKPGQYRSEETNRCRSSLGTAASSSLIPCREGQYRSPETNRCRNVTATSAPVPCKPGQERNPETNRCRAVKDAIPAAAFAVEPTQQTGEALAGWWALGGIGVLALGYGAWEWRNEMLAGVRKVSGFFTASK